MTFNDVRNLLSIVSFIVLAIFGVMLVSDCSIPFTEEPIFQAPISVSAFCDNSQLIDEIIKLSQEHQEDSVVNYEIFKIYDTEIVGRTDTRLDCRGKAFLSISDGPDDLYDVLFHVFTDRDGDTYIGYEFEQTP